MGIDLTAGIVRILTLEGTTAGTGFVITNDGLIATCAHVVKGTGAGPGDIVRVAFHATGEEREARVEPEWWREPNAEDVAILHLKEPLPERVTPLLLGSSGGVEGHTLITFGFPDAKPVEGMAGKCEVVGHTTERGFPVLQLRSSEVTPGFSGAPVLDTVTRRVVGMVTAITVPDRYGRLAETAFITPTETLRAVCPALVVSDVCPYRSLDAFTEADASFFFGCQRVVEWLVVNLRREPRFLAVLGPSGSGKSSLVRAGLIPQLRQGAVPGSDRWEVIVARPADQPFGQLETQGLAGASEGLAEAVGAWLDRQPERTRLVLVVDQFEELLVICPEELCRAFVAQLTGLLEADLPVTVVLVMRDDFYGRFARQAPALLGWLERGLVNVPLTLARDELRAIVERPAWAIGLKFEAGLVEAILEDAMETAPAGEGRVVRGNVLPLLEFALTQLWERRGDGMLTHEAYGAIGGVTGGLAQWADRAFYGLEEEQQRLARRILTDLVHLGDESQELPDSRWRRPLAVLYRDEGEQEVVHRVVRLLADARLLVTGRDVQSRQEAVELIHDALLREWGLLEGWLRQDRRFLAWRQGMEGRVRVWVESAPDDPAQRDAGWLLRGRDLAEAQRWLAERRDDLRVDGRDHIRESVVLREREERRRQRLILAVVVAAVVAAVVFLILAVLAGVQWRRAEEQRQRAEEQRRIAVARQLATQAQMVLDNTGTGLVCSVLLATESLSHSHTLEGDQAMRRGLGLLHREVARMEHEGPVLAVAFSPDGRWVASGNSDGTVRVWEAATGEEAVRMEHEGPVLAVAFSPDGRWVASGSEDRTARVWEAATGREVAWVVHEGRVEAVAFSPLDGRWVAAVSEDGTVRVWDATTGEEVARMEHEEPVLAVAFSPDGRWVASGEKCFADMSCPAMARVWEVATGQEVARMAHAGSVYAVAFSPDGRWLASGSSDHTARVWEAATGREVARMVYALWWVRAVAFSPDGRWVASGSSSQLFGPGEVRVWEATTGEEVARMEHELCVHAVAFSPDGQWVASGSEDGTVRVWEAATGQEVARMDRSLRMGNPRVWAMAFAFSPDGRWVASVSEDNTVRVWEAATGQEVARMAHEEPVLAVAFSPLDGRWVASGSEDGTVRVWEATTGEEVARMAHEWSVNAVAFSPDGQWVASGSGDGTVRVWEAATGQKVALMAHELAVSDVAFSPDGRWVASGSENGTVRVWEAATGQEVARMAHKLGVSDVAFSPDGHWVASGSRDHTVRVWEAATGEEVARMVHEWSVEAVAFSPDGRWVVSGSEDGTVRVWEAATGEEIARMEQKGNVYYPPTSPVAFSPDGKWVASGSGDGTVRVWLWRPEDLIAEACARLPRNLTREEWRLYIGDEPYRPTCPNLPVPER